LIEGWHGDDYLIVFDESEASDLTARYELGRWLAGYSIIGLKGWDDFIVKGVDGLLVTVPTVPIVSEYLAPLSFSIKTNQINPDERLAGKVKWYTKPMVFGGDPTAKENMVWVTLEQHVQLVKWWNELYREMNSFHGQRPIG
jgi:hypothetical protein